jgi:hypothetical protein
MKDYVLIGDDRVLIKIQKCIKCKTYRFKSDYKKNCKICYRCF